MLFPIIIAIIVQISTPGFIPENKVYISVKNNFEIHTDVFSAIRFEVVLAY